MAFDEGDEKRFFKHVIRKKGCWGWRSHLSTKGYASMSWEGRTREAHRLSWEIHYGPIRKGLCVCHRCDNPICTNPKHLFLGTHRQNIQDATAKGHMGAERWEKHPLSKLSFKTVKQVKKLRSYGVKWREISRILGFNINTLQNSITGKKVWLPCHSISL